MERNEKSYENIDLLIERAQIALEKIRAQLVDNHTNETGDKHGRTN
jgi:hypothetical protein